MQELVFARCRASESLVSNVTAGASGAADGAAKQEGGSAASTSSASGAAGGNGAGDDAGSPGEAVTASETMPPGCTVHIAVLLEGTGPPSHRTLLAMCISLADSSTSRVRRGRCRVTPRLLKPSPAVVLIARRTRWQARAPAVTARAGAGSATCSQPRQGFDSAARSALAFTMLWVVTGRRLPQRAQAVQCGAGHGVGNLAAAGAGTTCEIRDFPLSLESSSHPAGEDPAAALQRAQAALGVTARVDPGMTMAEVLQYANRAAHRCVHVRLRHANPAARLACPVVLWKVCRSH